jgi:glycine cleavage system H protein
MTPILVLLTVAIFVIVDFLLSRKKVAQVEAAEEAQPAARSDPDYMEGFLVPGKFRYHPGHSWVFKERARLARVGVDEFAAALMGRIDRIELPKPGTWLRQGQKAFVFYRDGEKTEILSPTEGEVVEVNPEIAKEPSLLRQDPYGAGWLLMIHVPDEETVSRNLVPETMVRNWMRDAAERLYSRQPQLAGAVAADGGRPAEDLFAALSDASWRDLTQELFLTK